MCFSHLHCSGSRLLSREQSLRFVDFPGLSRSYSGFRVFHKSTDLVGPAFCAFPARAAQAARSLTGALSPAVVRLLPSAVPASVSTRTSEVRVPCVCSWELSSSCDPPRECQPSRNSGSLWLETGSLFPVWWGGGAVSGTEFAPFPFPLPPASGRGWAGPPLDSFSL